MSNRAFVVSVAVGRDFDAKRLDHLFQLVKTLEHWVRNATPDDLESGLMTWPEGEGGMFLLPVRVK